MIHNSQTIFTSIYKLIAIFFRKIYKDIYAIG